ncbi:MAG: cysteine desulfurase, partial [Butyrivibrio sp.]|nr:cysteine desulfurase [Butyrivibrio sp.]
MKEIYADCAATTPISESALRAMTECMKNFYGNPSSVHHHGREAAHILEEARDKIASCLGAESEEIYYTSGGTEADNQAIFSAAAFGETVGKKHMIFSRIEHHAVLHCIPALEKAGFEISLVGVDSHGRVSPEEIEAACRADTVLVSVMYVNNEVGTIEPIAEIGKLCKEREILFHVDAVAAAGHIPIDVKKLGVGMLAISGHKFHGPRGIGALYVDKRIPVTNLLFGGSQERNKRPGTQNVPGAVAMAQALYDSIATLTEQNDKLEQLRGRLLDGLKDLDGMWVNGDPENRVPGIVNLGFEDVSGEALMLLLDMRGLSVSTGSACNTHSVEPSHVLTAMGLPREKAGGCIRFSFSADNT